MSNLPDDEVTRQFEAFMDVQIKRYDDTVRAVMQDVTKFHNDVMHAGESGPPKCELDFMMMFKDEFERRLNIQRETMLNDAFRSN